MMGRAKYNLSRGVVAALWQGVLQYCSVQTKRVVGQLTTSGSLVHVARTGCVHCLLAFSIEEKQDVYLYIKRIILLIILNYRAAGCNCTLRNSHAIQEKFRK